MFASATGRSPVVSAASERYMREEPLFVGGEEAGDDGGGQGQRQRRGGLPSNIRHTVVTMPKVGCRCCFFVGSGGGVCGCGVWCWWCPGCNLAAVFAVVVAYCTHRHSCALLAMVVVAAVVPMPARLVAFVTVR